MYNSILKKITRAAGALALPVVAALSSCVAEPDDSNLYTFTGQTIEDFLKVNDDFSNFNYILTRSGYDRVLSTYGTYTCFAPTNEAVDRYVDSLWNDVESVDENNQLLHNGMTEPSLEGLTDSLCLDIAQYHLAPSVVNSVTMSGAGTTILTMLGRSITTSVATNGSTMLNDEAAITSADNEMVNGMVHVIDKVIPRSNRLLGNEINRNGDYNIFYQALELTGLLDLINGATEKPQEFTYPSTTLTPNETAIFNSYTCKIGYTIFAVSDDVLHNVYGIDTLPDLIEYANKVYAHAADKGTGWYDYYRNNNATISTGADYTDSLNALNMLMRYHVIRGAYNRDVLAYNHNVVAANSDYGTTGDAYDYYETLLPKTLLKTWYVQSEGKTYINRWVANNSLTNQVQGRGTADMHPLRMRGTNVELTAALEPINGYVYPVDSILVYGAAVADGALFERIRVDYLTCLPELASNGYRGMNQTVLASLNNGVGRARFRVPVDYFDNVRVFNGNKTTIDINCPADPDADGANDYLLYKGDSFQGVGEFDLAIKLPPVPDGQYELRLDITLGGNYFGMMQFYLGSSSELADLSPVDIPLDFRMKPEDPRLGCTTLCGNNERYLTDLSSTATDEYKEDKGLASDQAMKTRGWMRAALDYWKQSYTGAGAPARFANYSVRRVITKRQFNQEDVWMRIKTVLQGSSKYQIDYIEFCPVDIADNQQYLEDMY